MNQFDEKTIQNLKYYVYMLIDTRNNKPFYVGKGFGNRVFDHLECVKSEKYMPNEKSNIIKEIIESGGVMGHMIIRHGLTESEAFQIEASIIDTLKYCNYNLSNLVIGHNSIEKGLMRSDEIIRLYNSEPLREIMPNCIIININKKYKRGIGSTSIYEATKETWLINSKKIPHLKYVLSEYKGQIVEVFEVEGDWYQKPRTKNKTIDKINKLKIQVEVLGFGFNGKVAQDEIRNKYINKSIAHVKKRGAAQAIRYQI
jgi:hypothetical protein